MLPQPAVSDDLSPNCCRVKVEDKPTQDVKDDSADGEDNAVSSEKEDGESGEGKAEQSIPDCAGDQKADDGEKVSAESDDPVDDSKEEEKVEVKKEEKDVTLSLIHI